MREIGERDERALADPQQLIEHQMRVARGLQRLAENRVIEALVGIAREIDIGIALHHREAARDRRRDVGGNDLEPARMYPAAMPPPRPPRDLPTADSGRASSRESAGRN